MTAAAAPGVDGVDAVAIPEQVARENIIAAARSLFARSLTHGSTGNISVRTETGFLVTPTAMQGVLSQLRHPGRGLRRGDRPRRNEAAGSQHHGATVEIGR